MKKTAHPDSEGEGYDKLVRYAWPNIRLAELYLNYAEAMNEAMVLAKKKYTTQSILLESVLEFQQLKNHGVILLLQKHQINTQLRRAYAKLSNTNV